MTVSNGGWVVLGDPSGAATLFGLLTAKSPLDEAAAPNLAAAGISGDAGATSGSIPNPLSAVPSASYGGGPVVPAQPGGAVAASIPEPGTLALLLVGALCGLAAWRRKRAI
jgi:hypothetical protein